MILAAVLSAAAAFRAGDFPAATHAYTAAYQVYPDDPTNVLALAQLALYANRTGEARHWLDVARRLVPNDPQIARDEHLLQLRDDPSFDRPDDASTPDVVPLVQTDPLPMVRVRVDGHDAYFLIDTGSPNILIDSSFAEQLGLTVTRSGEGTFAGGRHASIGQATVARLDLGSWTIRNLPATVMPVPAVMGDATHRVLGVLGTGLLAHFVTTIDYRNARLVLRSPSLSAEVERDAEARDATIVPMWLVGDHFIFVHARAGTAAEGLFNVDTGGTFGVELTRSALDPAGVSLDGDHASTGIGGGGVISFVPFTTSVTLGSLTENHVGGVYTPQGDQYGIFPFDVIGTLSHGFFRHSAVTFDFRAMHLIVEPD
jgi:hypothetical protein